MSYLKTKKSRKMKKLLLILCTLSLIACTSSKQKAVRQEKPEIKKSGPVFSIEKRAEKYALLKNKAIVSSFDYDAILIDGLFPILIKGKEKFVYINNSVEGPYADIKTNREWRHTVVANTLDRSKTAIIYSGEKDVKWFNYYNVEPCYSARAKDSQFLFWVYDKSGKKGLYSQLYSEKNPGLVLPLGNYTAIKINTDYELLEISFFKKEAIGYKSYYRDFFGDRIYESSNIKLCNLFGPGATIKSVNQKYTAIVYSNNGYELVSIDGKILVPGTYKNYKAEGDSAYIFSSDKESLRVNLVGQRI